jgi:transketolase
MHQGTDVSIIATGHLTWYAVEAAQALEAEGISVDLINIHTIKPLDEAAILASVARTGCVVTAEEHQIIGGLGSSVAQVVAQHNPSPMAFVGMEDCFGESGKPDQLLAKYNMGTANIIAKAKAVMTKK